MTMIELAFTAALSAMFVGCVDDTPTERRAAPNDGALPVGGTRSTPDDDAGSDVVGGATTTPAGGDAEAAGGLGQPEPALGAELDIEVSADAPTFVALSSASIIDLDGDERAAAPQWDLAFQGWDILTNGGASGSGEGGAFGPLPQAYLLAERDPTDLPFVIADKAAGAFLNWYFYDGQWHALYSRFHRYGVRSGGRLFKVQVLGYYGEVQGAPITALYRLRYAEVTAEGSGEVVEVPQLDATAGGLGGDDSAASACLSLRTGELMQLTPSRAASSTRWDLCFRRDSISVNGGLGGPGDVTAVDLDAEDSEHETLERLKERTAESEAAAFADIDFVVLSAEDLKYRGDRVVSAFTEAWADAATEPPSLPANRTWLVVGADGRSRFLVGLTGLEGSTPEAAGKVGLRIVQVR